MSPRARSSSALALVLLAVIALGASSGWASFAAAPEAWPESDFQILWAAGHGLARIGSGDFIMGDAVT